MQNLRYLSNVVTLGLDEARCTGCGQCVEVCPHAVLALNGKKAHIVDRDGCMECGACATNCPVAAVSVTPGVGCAAYIISGWLYGKQNACCTDNTCC